MTKDGQKAVINKQGKQKNNGAQKREVKIGFAEMNRLKFISNYITTSKYTALSFFPKALMLQFKRYANIYFLGMAILQSIPLISPVNPFSSIAPLMFVISLSIIREGFEDLNRHRSDLELNSFKTVKYTKGDWHEVNWKDVYVGDIVKVVKDEFLPADLVCLSSSDYEGNCFIQTSSLDGEKNLKPRQAFKETQDLIGSGDVIRLVGKMELPRPNPNLYEAGGFISIGGDKNLKIDVKNFMLRGAILKNTDWVIGVCAYTGKETKIMKNAEDSKYKQSNIEERTNLLILYIFLFQLSICLSIAIFNWNWTYNNADMHKGYITNEFSSFSTALLSLGTVFVLTNSMIPISLIISLEMVKMAQAYFINVDEEMYCQENGRRPKVFTSSLNEELGQIEFIFSDKTGTLTCNKMEFKMCVIGDVLYGDTSVLEDGFFSSKPSEFDYNQNEEEELSFYDKRLQNLKTGLIGDKEINFKIKSHKNKPPLKIYKKQSHLVHEYFLLLALCHDCVLEKDEDGVRYQGESPDEIALVATASQMGFVFKGQSQNYKSLNILGENQAIELLQFFPFNSKRKRASVIVRHNGMVKLLIKGADNFIIDRLSKGGEEMQPYQKYIEKRLKIFSKKGLRTLCMAERTFSEEEYLQIKKRVDEATNSTKPDEVLGRILL